MDVVISILVGVSIVVGIFVVSFVIAGLIDRRRATNPEKMAKSAAKEYPNFVWYSWFFGFRLMDKILTMRGITDYKQDRLDKRLDAIDRYHHG